MESSGFFSRNGRNRISTLIAKNADVIKFISRNLEHNPEYYKTYFKFDIAIIKHCTKHKQPIIWFYRDSGTCCIQQKRFREPDSFSIFEFCNYRNDKSVKAFDIDNLHFDENNQIIGDIYSLDYLKAVEYVMFFNHANKYEMEEDSLL